MDCNLAELPSSWAWTKANEISKLIRGVSYKRNQANEKYGLGLLPILRAGNIQAKLILDDDLIFVEPQLVSSEQLIRAGDVVLAMSSGSANKVGKAAQARFNWNGSFGAFCGLLRPNEEIDPWFFGAFFETQNYRKTISNLAAGININNLRRQHLESMPIPLAPLPEQHRIVARIEELFSRLDAGVEALQKAKAQLQRYRQAVLKAAVEGRLTEEWRKAHPDVEPAEKLLEQIQYERRTKIGKKYAPPELDSDSLPELPHGWVWTTIEQIAKVETGATPLRSNSKYYENGKIPWVTSGSLNDLFIIEADEFITELAIKKTNAKVFPVHSLLVAMYGEGKTRGKVSELLLEAATNQACAAILFEGSADAIRQYVKTFFEKNYDDIRRLSSGGVQPNLNLSIIKSTRIPLPPLEEIEIILQEIACRSSQINNAKGFIDKNMKLSDCFYQSILKRAFEGKLVPQNPSDEPASILLERIKAERIEESPRRGRKSNNTHQMRLTQ